jgi:hypothetical protein
MATEVGSLLEDTICLHKYAVPFTQQRYGATAVLTAARG